MHGLSLLTPTRVAGVRRSSASVDVSICPHDRTRTAETKINELGTGMVHHKSSPININISSKVKGQGHRVTKCKKGDRVAGRRELCTLFSAQPLVITVL